MIRSVIILGLGLCLLVGAGLWFVWQDKEAVMHSPLNLTEDAILMVEPGTSLANLALSLAERGWLANPNYLIFEARLQEKAGRIKSGEFLISRGTTVQQLLDQLIIGKVVQHDLTLVEGWNFRELRDAIRQNAVLQHTIDDWSPGAVAQALDLQHDSPEGLFFPDTYHFPRGTTDIAFLQRARDRLRIVLEQEWQQRAADLPYETAYEALIMASIIEKETAVAEERGRIAGVFVRRLQKGMKLQTDPTVIYAMGEVFDGDIRRKDLAIDSPYNTYVYPGLPPTPIALVGREAIHAALHPEPGNTLYFVAKGDGTHHFSATLREHNNAVRKYQLNQ